MVKTDRLKLKLEKVLGKLERVGKYTSIYVGDKTYFIVWSWIPYIEVELLDKECEDPSWPAWGKMLKVGDDGKLRLEKGHPSLDGWVVDKVSSNEKDIENFLDFVEALLNHL